MLYLTLVSLAKADDSNAGHRLSKHQSVEPFTDIAQGPDALFAIVLAGIHPEQGSLELEACYLLEGESTLSDVALILGWIEFDVRGQIVSTKKIGGYRWTDSIGGTGNGIKRTDAGM